MCEVLHPSTSPVRSASPSPFFCQNSSGASSHSRVPFPFFPARFCATGQGDGGAGSCHGAGFAAAAGADCPAEEGDGPAETARCCRAGRRATRGASQQTAGTVGRFVFHESSFMSFFPPHGFFLPSGVSLLSLGSVTRVSKWDSNALTCLNASTERKAD